MPPKNTKRIADVTSPGRVAPSASGRPILVTNRPVLTNDPMVVAGATPESGDANSSNLINRSAKTIKPMDLTLSAQTEESKPEEAAEEKLAESTSAVITEESTPASSASDGESKSTPAVESKGTLPEEPSTGSGIKAGDPDKQGDSDAEISADELAAAEAQTVREQELEALIASGKYAVPINAVQRKRSHTHTVLLCFLALVLAIALADVVFDAGIVKLSVNIPHTHLFSGTH